MWREMTSCKRDSHFASWTWGCAELHSLTPPARPGSSSRGPGVVAAQGWACCRGGTAGPAMPRPPWHVPCVVLQVPPHTWRLPIYRELAGELNSEWINKDLTCYHFRKVADCWLDTSLGESTVKKCFWPDVFSSNGLFHLPAGSALN